MNSIATILPALAAIALAGAGMLCLMWSWQGKYPGMPWLAPAGWALQILAMVFWIMASGAEFGVTFSLLTTGSFAWIAVMLNLRQTSATRKPSREISEVTALSSLAMPRLGTVLHHVLLFLLSVPVSAVVASLVTLLFIRSLPWQIVNELVLGVYLMPVIWGALAYWACADEKMLRVGTAISLIGMISAAVLFL